MAVIPGFVGPSYVSTATNVSAQVLRNWMPQSVEVGGESAQVIYMPTPGITTLVELPTAPIRSLFAQDGRAFAVGGQVFYEFDAAGNKFVRGTLSAVDQYPAIINSNGTAGDQLYITSGGKGDIFTLSTNTLTAITAAGYPAGTAMGTYLDSYFATTKANSAQFNISGILDGTAWSGLDFAIRTSQSDNLVGIIQNNRILWLIGSQTSEPWYDSGAASFPFQAVPQVICPEGCIAPFTIGRVSLADGQSVTNWLSGSARGGGIFVAAVQYAPQRISRYAQEAEWATYTTLTDAVTYSYSEQGHDFTVLTFPSGNATWVFDHNEKQWHQRTWWNVTTGNHDRHRGWVHCFAFGNHYVGDWQTGTIYRQGLDLIDDDGANIVRERQSPHANAERRLIYFSEFQLDFDTGEAPINMSPTVNLSWSNDGGKTFGSEQQLSSGVTGDYGARCRLPGNLGSGRNRVWRIRATDIAPYQGLMQAYVTAEAGTS